MSAKASDDFIKALDKIWEKAKRESSKSKTEKK